MIANELRPELGDENEIRSIYCWLIISITGDKLLMDAHCSTLHGAHAHVLPMNLRDSDIADIVRPDGVIDLSHMEAPNLLRLLMDAPALITVYHERLRRLDIKIWQAEKEAYALELTRRNGNLEQKNASLEQENAELRKRVAALADAPKGNPVPEPPAASTTAPARDLLYEAEFSDESLLAAARGGSPTVRPEDHGYHED